MQPAGSAAVEPGGIIPAFRAAGWCDRRVVEHPRPAGPACLDRSPAPAMLATMMSRDPGRLPAALALVAVAATAGWSLEPLPYNHPGLVVDLGVGLWAWPLPCDVDGDGDYDLVVSCPDKPSNGIYVFENVSGDTATNRFPVFRPGRRIGSTERYVMPSYVDDDVDLRRVAHGRDVDLRRLAHGRDVDLRRLAHGRDVDLRRLAHGRLRVLTPGFEHPDFLARGLAEKVPLGVDPGFHVPQGTQPKGPRLRHNQWRYVDYDGDGTLDLIVAVEDWSDYGWDDGWNERGEWTHGPLHGWVYVLRGLPADPATSTPPAYGPPEFVEAGGRRLEVFGCPSPNFEDFDGDGDLDLVCGEFLDSFTYFENIGTRTEPRYAEGRRIRDAAGAVVSMDLQMIVPVAFDWDRDGDMDLVVGDEDGRVALVENLGTLATADTLPAGSQEILPAGSQEILPAGSRGTPVFAQPRYFQQEADTLKCGALATPVVFDWDGDGDLDILCGNTAGYIEWFENLSGPGAGRPMWAAPRRLEAGGTVFRIMAGNRSIQGPAEAKWGYTTFSVADWDADGLPDIVLNSITGAVEWLRNVGTRTQPRLDPPRPVEVEWDEPQPPLAWGWLRPEGNALLTQWRTTPVVHDFNGDGLPDLAMLDIEGYLAFFERGRHDGELVLRGPRRAFVDEAGAPLRLTAGTAGKSGRRKLCATDWDGDGRFDLLVNSANADLYRQVGMRDGTWVLQHAGTIGDRNIEGHDVSPAVSDFDGDGVPDFLGGAEDGRLYFLENPRSAVATAAAPAILDAGFIYDRGPHPQVHASTIAETPTGLVAAWFGGTRERHPDVGIHVSRFVDGRWTSSREVATGVQPDGTRHPTWNPVLFQPREGPLLLFFKVGPSPQTWWGELQTSADGGATWTAARRLPDGILGPIKNKPVQLADGAILAASSTESPEEPSRWSVHFERSDDLGATWRKIGPVNDGVEIQAIQPSILSLGGDRLLAIGRSRQDRVFEVRSDDGGETWGEMTLGALPNNNSGTDAVTLADGRHLLVYNHVGGTPGKWGGRRTPLNLAVSPDGRTWQAAVVLEDAPGEYSYPAIIQASDGLVHVTYTWNRRKVRHVVIDPARLAAVPMVDGAWPRSADR
jgi:predicted neuraminidase